MHRSSGAISAGRSCWSMARFSRGNFLKRPRDTRGTMDTRDTTRQKTTGDTTRHARDLEKMGPLAGTFHELLSKCGKFWRHKSTFRPPTSSTNTLSRAQRNATFAGFVKLWEGCGSPKSMLPVPLWASFQSAFSHPNHAKQVQVGNTI